MVEKVYLLMRSLVKPRSASMSFRLVRNRSLFSEGFPTRFACGNDNLCGLTYDFLSTCRIF